MTILRDIAPGDDFQSEIASIHTQNGDSLEVQFSMVGEPQECLVEATINIDEAYGYWPVRSFRASEEVAAAYYQLYKAMGGKYSLCL